MIEKKTAWAVTRDLKIVQRTVIVDEGKILASKRINDEDDEYFTTSWDYICYFDTYEQAKDYVENESAAIREMVPKVRSFIERLENHGLRKNFGIEKKDYLSSYAESDISSYRQEYNDECDYAKKLEAFINSHMLNIDGHMIPFDQVRDIQWYTSDCPDEWEADQWKAVLTTTNGHEYTTCSKEDVRLIWATFGHCAGSWFIDNDIDYDKDEED